MDATGPVLALMKRLGGYSEEDVKAIFAAGENRLMDLKAICHGGQMSDGVTVPGMGAVYQAVVKMTESHNKLAAEVRAMREETAARTAAEAKAPVKLTPAKRGQTGVKQQRKEG